MKVILVLVLSLFLFTLVGCAKKYTVQQECYVVCEKQDVLKVHTIYLMDGEVMYNVKCKK